MITHDYKLIFIHIPKCTGRSISEIFNQRFDHFTLRYYEWEYEHYYPDYNAFAIVRNPYDRYVSMYHYIKNHRRHKTDQICVRNPLTGDIAPFKYWLAVNMNRYAGHFRADSAQAEWGTDYMIGSPFWFSPQSRFIMDNYSSMDKVKIFKYEDGMDVIKEWLHYHGVPVMTIPHLNKSEHDDYLSCYDDELLEMVNHFNSLKEDCNLLGYNLITHV